MNGKVRGLLGHHWHHPYWANIVLWFDSDDPVHCAEAVLLAGILDDPAWPAWVAGKQRGTLYWAGRDEQLKPLKAHLASLGADASAIDSVATSIDHGEEFTFTVSVPDPRQLDLHFAGG